MMGSVAVPSLGLLVGLTFLPESPRWLVNRDRPEEARDILARVNGPARAKMVVEEIAESIKKEKRIEHGSWGEMIRPGGIRMALIIAIGLAILQQFSGGLPLTLYAPKIFMAAGFPDPKKAIGISVLIQCWSLLCVVVALVLVERVGRKPLLLVGMTAMCAGHLALALLFVKSITGPVVPSVLILTTGMSNISISPLAWVILAEIFPTRIRGKGMAVATFCLFLASFAVTQLFPVADDYFKNRYGEPSGVFLLLAIICAAGTAWIAWMVPETKGRTLEEIANQWLRKTERPA
jgi:sugar porter (SP) family MFS transporter